MEDHQCQISIFSHITLRLSYLFQYTLFWNFALFQTSLNFSTFFKFTSSIIHYIYLASNCTIRLVRDLYITRWPHSLHRIASLFPNENEVAHWAQLYLTPKDLLVTWPCAACEMDAGAAKPSLCGEDIWTVDELEIQSDEKLIKFRAVCRNKYTVLRFTDASGVNILDLWGRNGTWITSRMR